MTDKNPHDTGKPAIQGGTGYQLGYVNLNASGDDVEMKTCTKKDCATADQLTATITVE